MVCRDFNRIRSTLLKRAVDADRSARTNTGSVRVLANWALSAKVAPNHRRYCPTIPKFDGADGAAGPTVILRICTLASRPRMIN